MTRSFVDAMGGRWPPEIASVVNGRPVTFAEIRQRRKERQTNTLNWKREMFVQHRAAIKVTVYFDADCEVWLARLSTVTIEQWAREGDESLRVLFPCGLLPFVSWNAWKQAFAREHQVDAVNGQPRGLAYCWGKTEAGKIVSIDEVIAAGADVLKLHRNRFSKAGLTQERTET